MEKMTSYTAYTNLCSGQSSADLIRCSLNLLADTARADGLIFLNDILLRLGCPIVRMGQIYGYLRDTPISIAYTFDNVLEKWAVTFYGLVDVYHTLPTV